jgi:hypothetical protein
MLIAKTFLTETMLLKDDIKYFYDHDAVYIVTIFCGFANISLCQGCNNSDVSC